MADVSGSPEYYFEIKSKNRFNLNWKELWSYKELFYFFAWRDIKVKYKETFFGVLWAVIQPLFMMVVLVFFLGSSLKASQPGMSYPVFLLSGLILWVLFSSGLTSAGNSMVINAGIIKKIFFPRVIVPVAAILVGVFDFLIAFALFLMVLLYYRQPVDVISALWMWPSGLVITILGTLGLGCWLAALNIKYRDFRYALPFFVQMLLFVTPVIYPLNVLKAPWLQKIFALNPMYAALAFFRGPMSAAPMDSVLTGISLVSAIFLLISGWFYFRRTEAYFADLV